MTGITLPAELTNEAARAFVAEWADIACPARIEVVSAADDERLREEALAAGELMPVRGGRFFSRSHPLDTARSEQRTVVATSRESDRGAYNNWRPAADVVKRQRERMRDGYAGKTMYVVPYLMAPKGSPFEKFAAGVQLTDNRTVVLHMIRMARVAVSHINGLAEPDHFVRAVHVTGDLDTLGQGTDDDERLFATVADERTILHFGSAYGGNALLGKIAHGLRQGSYDGWVSGEFLGEQFMLLAIVDLVSGERYHVCGGFPSASGKTNLAMTLAPDALGDRYRVEFYGDDIAWIRLGDDGRLYAINPENGVFGVARDTNEQTNPGAIEAIAPGTDTIFTNVAYNRELEEVWWEGKTELPPADVTGWRDWRGELISERDPARVGEPWAHPNGRFTTTLANVPNVAADYDDGAGVPIDAIIFGGRTRDREPLIRAIDDLAEGVYDGLTLGAEATFAAEGVDGQLRYDPMSMRPFFSYGEGDYARHWLELIGRASVKPVFAHVNWFQRDADGGFLWPGYRENLRALLWLARYQKGEVQGVRTAVGVLPALAELNMEGLDLAPDVAARLLSIDVARWRQEMRFRREHLELLPGLPQEIWDVHERVERALAEA